MDKPINHLSWFVYYLDKPDKEKRLIKLQQFQLQKICISTFKLQKICISKNLHIYFQEKKNCDRKCGVGEVIKQVEIWDDMVFSTNHLNHQNRDTHTVARKIASHGSDYNAGRTLSELIDFGTTTSSSSRESHDMNRL